MTPEYFVFLTSLLQNSNDPIETDTYLAQIQNKKTNTTTLPANNIQYANVYSNPTVTAPLTKPYPPINTTSHYKGPLEYILANFISSSTSTPGAYNPYAVYNKAEQTQLLDYIYSCPAMRDSLKSFIATQLPTLVQNDPNFTGILPEEQSEVQNGLNIEGAKLLNDINTKIPLDSGINVMTFDGVVNPEYLKKGSHIIEPYDPSSFENLKLGLESRLNYGIEDLANDSATIKLLQGKIGTTLTQITAELNKLDTAKNSSPTKTLTEDQQNYKNQLLVAQNTLTTGDNDLNNIAAQIKPVQTALGLSLVKAYGLDPTSDQFPVNYSNVNTEAQNELNNVNNINSQLAATTPPLNTAITNIDDVIQKFPDAALLKQLQDDLNTLTNNLNGDVTQNATNIKNIGTAKTALQNDQTIVNALPDSPEKTALTTNVTNLLDDASTCSGTASVNQAALKTSSDNAATAKTSIGNLDTTDPNFGSNAKLIEKNLADQTTKLAATDKSILANKANILTLSNDTATLGAKLTNIKTNLPAKTNLLKEITTLGTSNTGLIASAAKLGTDNGTLSTNLGTLNTKINALPSSSANKAGYLTTFGTIKDAVDALTPKIAALKTAIGTNTADIKTAQDGANALNCDQTQPDFNTALNTVKDNSFKTANDNNVANNTQLNTLQGEYQKQLTAYNTLKGEVDAEAAK